ncbi:hypothetical protein X956_08115 [Trueperella pyogenes TP8]|nr:hypothetical protein X956_08115 [Trueperella pyogenes TP8]
MNRYSVTEVLHAIPPPGFQNMKVSGLMLLTMCFVKEAEREVA